MSDSTTGRFIRAYIVVTAIAAHASLIALWAYERVTCEGWGCIQAGALENLILWSVLGVALIAAFVVFADSVLRIHYAGDGR